MKLIDRYVSKTVLGTILLVTVTLIGFQVFILFLNELEDLGRGGYQIAQAIPVVFLQVPGEVYLFFPVACLIGALIGLGQLASHRELVVMQASGVSVKRLTWAVLKTSVVLIIFVACLGEFFAPKFLAQANEKRWEAMYNGQAVVSLHGVWVKHNTDFIVVGDVISSTKLTNIVQFHFNEKHELLFTRGIRELTREPGATTWTALDIKESLFTGNSVQKKTLQSMPWTIPLDLVTLKAADKAPDELSFLALRDYVKNAPARSVFYQHKLAYWQRLMQPLTTVVMMLLAIPFIFGPLRSSTMGAKLLMGVGVGFGFYLLSRFFGPLAQVLGWPPVVAATLPTAFFAVLGLYWVGRVRH